MNPTPLPPFTQARVLVVGDVMLDLYWHGQASRISPEAPVPVVRVARPEPRAGGAANVAANVAALGAPVRLMGLVGEDEHAQALAQVLHARGVGAALVGAADARTITKLRVMAQHQQVIRLDFEEGFTAQQRRTLAERFAQELQGVQVVLFSDYAKGTLADIAPLLQAARAAGKWAVVDPKGTDFERYRGASVITPNLGEFEAVMGRCADDAELVARARELAERLDLQAVLVTRSEKGMSLVPRQGAALHLPTVAQEVYDVTGAGDTVVATLGCALGAGCGLQQAVQLANAAAGVAVSRMGTSTLTWPELQAAARRAAGVQAGTGQGAGTVPAGRSSAQSATIGTPADLVAWRAAARAQGEQVVMTNGCFDLLHPGHLNYLARARALGHRLVVAVNDDASVQRLKGPTRPVNPLAVRQQMLAGLAAVDYVVSFAQDTPESLYAQVLPDVLVKGGDYRAEDVVGGAAVRAAGGEVVILPFVEGHSSTGLIQRIQTLPKG
jgi:D-beta-D-heptose 7-phosphate kinase/D-beta-D-heptose 1-phosphate adenosyltransferase